MSDRDKMPPITAEPLTSEPDCEQTPPAAHTRVLLQQICALQAQVQALEKMVRALHKAPDAPIADASAPAASPPIKLAKWKDRHDGQGETRGLASAVEALEPGLDLAERNLVPDLTDEAPLLERQLAGLFSAGEAEPPTHAPDPTRARARVNGGRRRKAVAGRALLIQSALTRVWSAPYHPPRRLKWLVVALEARSWLLVLGWLAAIYLVNNFVVYRVLDPALAMYGALPLLWSWLAFQAWLGWRYGLHERPAFSERLAAMALLSGMFQVAVALIAGLLLGFGRSPYGHRPLVVLGNLAYVGTDLVGVELSRAYLGAAFGRRRLGTALLALSVLFALVGIPFGQLDCFSGRVDALGFLGKTALPAFAENLLATFLALAGGPLPALAYRGVLAAFEWLAPILPNPEWIVAAFLGTLVPMVSLMVLQSEVLPKSARSEGASFPGAKQEKKGVSRAWAAVGIVAVALLWFNVGLFGVRPHLVSGNSMKPTMVTGDLYITQEVPPEEIQVGDIIHFSQEGVFVVHRVIEIQQDRGRLIFFTQGDNNRDPDPPIQQDHLAGKVVMHLPKVGWPSIYLRRLLGKG